NWALVYPDGLRPILAPLYDPVCVCAFFNTIPPTDYAVNRAIDNKLREFSWEDLAKLLNLAQVPRASRVLRLARSTVWAAQREWPHVLDVAPASMRSVVKERLHGGVALARS